VLGPIKVVSASPVRTARMQLVSPVTTFSSTVRPALPSQPRSLARKNGSRYGAGVVGMANVIFRSAAVAFDPAVANTTSSAPQIPDRYLLRMRNSPCEGVIRLALLPVSFAGAPRRPAPFERHGRLGQHDTHRPDHEDRDEHL